MKWNALFGSMVIGIALLAATAGPPTHDHIAQARKMVDDEKREQLIEYAKQSAVWIQAMQSAGLLAAGPFNCAYPMAYELPQNLVPEATLIVIPYAGGIAIAFSLGDPVETVDGDGDIRLVMPVELFIFGEDSPELRECFMRVVRYFLP